MQSDYIERRNDGFYVAGTRVSLDSVVYAFRRGDSPERILERYPLLERTAKVYGAIAFYLDHRVEIDAYLETGRREWEASAGPPLSETNPALSKRLDRARSQAGASDSGEPRS